MNSSYAIRASQSFEIKKRNDNYEQRDGHSADVNSSHKNGFWVY